MNNERLEGEGVSDNHIAIRMDELICAVDEIFVGKIPSEDDLYGIHQVLVERRDAELARQSVTDEAVQRAIEWMEIEKESAQNSWERAGAEWRTEPGTQEMHDERMASFDLAIQALRQMKPSDADVDKIIATGEYLYGLNDDNLADLVIQTNEVQNYIVESFTALRQMKPSEWIPVSDRLPTDDDADEKGNVLCYWTDEAIETYQARWVDEWNSDRNHKDKITHWRPLPEPPESEG